MVSAGADAGMFRTHAVCSRARLKYIADDLWCVCLGLVPCIFPCCVVLECRLQCTYLWAFIEWCPVDLTILYVYISLVSKMLLFVYKDLSGLTCLCYTIL